jgi:pyruvate/2-oxoglutarate dehydrogenase complex dihydrolipoamide acyltransferase (E2) component
MCLDPISMTLAIASSVNSYVGQQQQADAQEAAQKRATELERERHLAEMGARRRSQALRQIAAAQRIGAASRGNLRAMARARVAAGEAGLRLSSFSVSTLVDNLNQKFATFRFTEQQKEEMLRGNEDLAFTDGEMRHRQNLQSINRPINQPSILGAALQGAQTGLSAASVMRQWDVPSAPTGADPGVSGGLSARPGAGASSSPLSRAQAPSGWDDFPLPLTHTGGNTVLPGTGPGAVVESVDQSFMDWSVGLGQPPVQRWD